MLFLNNFLEFPVILININDNKNLSGFVSYVLLNKEIIINFNYKKILYCIGFMRNSYFFLKFILVLITTIEDS